MPASFGIRSKEKAFVVPGLKVKSQLPKRCPREEAVGLDGSVEAISVRRATLNTWKLPEVDNRESTCD